MSKLNQKIVLFIEPGVLTNHKPSKIGYLFMNRLVIEEDAKNEIFENLSTGIPFSQSSS